MASSTVRSASFTQNVFGTDFKNIIAKRPELVLRNAGRLVSASAGQVNTFEAGTVLGVVTASGLYAPYASGNTDGSQNAAALLLHSASVDQYGNGSDIAVAHGGEFWKDLLIGLDAGAITALGAKTIVENGLNILKF